MVADEGGEKMTRKYETVNNADALDNSNVRIMVRFLQQAHQATLDENFLDAATYIRCAADFEEKIFIRYQNGEAVNE